MPRPATLRPIVRGAPLFGVLVLFLAPSDAAGQYGFFSDLADRFSDLSFYADYGSIAPEGDDVRGRGLRSFGMELLFTIGTVTRPTGPPPEEADSVRLVWRESRVERTAEGTDTVDVYEVVHLEPAPPTREVWAFELGLGYGQLSGFEARDPRIELKGAVRTLPSLSLYATYLELGTYFGLRSGLMEFKGLQVLDGEGGAWGGSGSSFLSGIVVGQAWTMADLNVFLEGAYTVRDFPSVEWSGSPPPGTPRSLNLSGWSVGAGIQFAVGN